MNRFFRAWKEVLGASILTVLSCLFLIGLGIPVSRASGGVDNAYDLSVTKMGSPDPVIAGNNLTYNIVATNEGSPDYVTVNISDTLPAGTRFVSLSDTPPGGSCSSPTVGDPSPPPVSCTAASLLAPGDTYSLDIVVHVCPDVPAGSLSNTGTTTAVCEMDWASYPNCQDPNSANNSSMISTTVDTQSDLVVTQSVSPSTAYPGSTVQYIISIENKGPSDSHDTVLTQMLSPGVIIQSVTGPGSCTGVGTNELTCDVGLIPAPNQCLPPLTTNPQFIVTVLIPSSQPPGASVMSTATAESTGNSLPDVVPPDNTATNTLGIVVQTPVLSLLGLIACALILLLVGVRLLPKGVARN